MAVIIVVARIFGGCNRTRRFLLSLFVLLSLFFLYSGLDSIKSFVIEFLEQKVPLKVNMSVRFQAKAMVHPVLRCIYMKISAPFSKLKKTTKKHYTGLVSATGKDWFP